MSSSKKSAERLPGEPKTALEITYDLAKETGAGPGSITSISQDAGKKLLGKGSQAVIDLSGPAYNISSVDFLSDASKSSVL